MSEYNHEPLDHGWDLVDHNDEVSRYRRKWWELTWCKDGNSVLLYRGRPMDQVGYRGPILPMGIIEGIITHVETRSIAQPNIQQSDDVYRRPLEQEVAP